MPAPRPSVTKEVFLEAALSDFSESEIGELSDEVFILGIDRLVETILELAQPTT